MALTPKQRKFAENIVMGLNPSDAYREAGYSASEPKTVATEAYRLLRNPEISPIIEAGKRASMNEAVTTRQTLLNRVEAINRQAFEELQDGSISEGFKAFQAFQETFKILNGNLPDVYELVEREMKRENPFDFETLINGAYFG